MYDSGSTVVNIITLDAKIVILGIAVVSLLYHFRSSPIFFLLHKGVMLMFKSQ